MPSDSKPHQPKWTPRTFWLRLVDCEIDRNSYPFSNKSSAVCWMQTWASIPYKITYFLVSFSFKNVLTSPWYIEKICFSTEITLSPYAFLISSKVLPNTFGTFYFDKFPLKKFLKNIRLLKKICLFFNFKPLFFRKYVSLINFFKGNWMKWS